MKYLSWTPAISAEKITRGLPVRALDDVQRYFGLTNGELADLVGIPVRTLSRRRREERLSPAESERTWRLARLFERAVQVLGDRTKARAWMERPNPGLGGKRPLDYARTEPGAGLVDRLLGSIEHGLPL